MDIKKINSVIEASLNGMPANLCKKDYELITELDRYKFRTAERLNKYWAKYQSGKITKEDFLVSLRNYLLVFQVSIRLPVNITIEDNNVGLRLDSEGLCFATYNFPAYLNESIVSQGFLRSYEAAPVNNRFFLGVSPNIYRLTGFRFFKSIRQKFAVNGVLNMPEGYTTLVSLPTGGGKSLITQTMAYQKQEGLTITIVPTVSLAMDQVRVAYQNIKTAKENEIACYYSGLSQSDKDNIITGIKNQSLRLLFISPEALIKNKRFEAAVYSANEAGYLKNIIIDEAHIVIEWGTFFREDYQCLEPWRNNLIEKNPKLKTVLLSATFEKNTVKMLKSMFSVPEKWIEIRCDALRREPRFTLIEASSWSDKNRKIKELLACLPRPLIVYVTTPDQAKHVQELAAEIGFTNTVTFTGKTTDDKREEIIRDWASSEYDLVIATSAFGVGVDKPDVRTVLHLYVPENSNKYYQELGRGGRDGLPCLSVMCIHPEKDLDSAFFMTDKVLSTTKILGRWDSMLNSPTSLRFNDTYTLDTSVKPKYNDPDYAEDITRIDRQWNIYVILLLRRYELIKICEMKVDPETQNYYMRISIIDHLLLHESSERQLLIEKIRTKEWKKNEREFQMMQRTVLKGKNDCWSEMFANTYGLVSEYCAGCDNHTHIIESDKDKFELVRKVPLPLRKKNVELDNLFGGANEALLLANIEDYELIGRIIDRGFPLVLIDNDASDEYMNLLLNMHPHSDVNVIGIDEFARLSEHGDYYMTSGDIIALYNSDMLDGFRKYNRIRKYNKAGRNRILHIVEKDIFFPEIGKNISGAIDGPLLEEYMLERM